MAPDGKRKKYFTPACIIVSMKTLIQNLHENASIGIIMIYLGTHMRINMKEDSSTRTNRGGRCFSIGEELLEGVATQKAAGEALRYRCKMATSDSKAPLRTVKRVQFGILSPDEIVSLLLVNK